MSEVDRQKSYLLVMIAIALELICMQECRTAALTCFCHHNCHGFIIIQLLVKYYLQFNCILCKHTTLIVTRIILC